MNGNPCRVCGDACWTGDLHGSVHRCCANESWRDRLGRCDSCVAARELKQYRRLAGTATPPPDWADND